MHPVCYPDTLCSLSTKKTVILSYSVDCIDNGCAVCVEFLVLFAKLIPDWQYVWYVRAKDAFFHLENHEFAQYMSNAISSHHTWLGMELMDSLTFETCFWLSWFNSQTLLILSAMEASNHEFAQYMSNAISSHHTWLGNLKKMVYERAIVPLQLDSSKCGFGHSKLYRCIFKNADRETFTAEETDHAGCGA